tara:strand:- start:9481 stop:10173 length:693 start_codon:yes stop_codon:yes gene_type:complete
MSTQFRKLKNDLKDIEKDSINEFSGAVDSGGESNSKLSNYILLFAFIATLAVYTGSQFSFSNWNIFAPFSETFSAINEPSEDLLNRMGAWMTEMGYGELSHEELKELRSEGVTATYTNGIREVGYSEVTLDQLVELQRADVSDTYARMMKELGYELTIDELIQTRNNGLTAAFTSQMLDLGYTKEELTKENLMRLTTLGVTSNLAERLIERRGERPTIEELVRYRISNQN